MKKKRKKKIHKMSILDFFDIHDIEHLKAFDELINGDGAWPDYFIIVKNQIIDDMEFPDNWRYLLLKKLANAYIEEKIEEAKMSKIVKTFIRDIVIDEYCLATITKDGSYGDIWCPIEDGKYCNTTCAWFNCKQEVMPTGESCKMAYCKETPIGRIVDEGE